jgi:hypothetical protein
MHNPLRVAQGYAAFWRDLATYRGAGQKVEGLDLYPCVTDRYATHPLDYSYFYQDTWAARKIFEADPPRHVDIGSTALLVGVLAQFTRVVSVEIRPLEVRLPGLEVVQGTVLALPFADASVVSLSSLCVIEHIGLGRYGDPIDGDGTVKAAREMRRVLAGGGDLYVSVPIEAEDRTHFNAHRAFGVDSFCGLFEGLTLKQARFIQGNELLAEEESPDTSLPAPAVVGLFHFRKE